MSTETGKEEGRVKVLDQGSRIKKVGSSPPQGLPGPMASSVFTERLLLRGL